MKKSEKYTRKKTASSTNGTGQAVCMQKNPNRSIFITQYKTQLQVKDLNIKSRFLNLTEEKMGNNLELFAKEKPF